MIKPKVVLLIFVSGKIVLTGAKVIIVSLCLRTSRTMFAYTLSLPLRFISPFIRFAKKSIPRSTPSTLCFASSASLEDGLVLVFALLHHFLFTFSFHFLFSSPWFVLLLPVNRTPLPHIFSASYFLSILHSLLYTSLLIINQPSTHVVLYTHFTSMQFYFFDLQPCPAQFEIRVQGGENCAVVCSCAPISLHSTGAPPFIRYLPRRIVMTDASQALYLSLMVALIGGSRRFLSLALP